MTIKAVYAALAPGDEVSLGGTRYEIVERDGNRVAVLKLKPRRRKPKGGESSDG